MREGLKRVWRVMLMVALLVMIVPDAASATQAEEAVYGGDVTTSGIDFNYRENSMPTVETYYKAGDGTITWTPAPTDDDGNVTGTAVLTLDHATVKTTGDLVSAISISADADVEIRVTGDCYLESQTDEFGSVMLLQQKEKSNKFSIKGVNGGRLEIYNETGDYSLEVYAELYVSDVTLKTSSQMDSMDEGFSVVGNLTFENAEVIANIMYCTEKIHVVSGTVTCSEEMWPCDVVTVDSGATVTANRIFVYDLELVGGEGTVNAFMYLYDEVDTDAYIDIHAVGNPELSESWAIMIANSANADVNISLSIPEESSVLIPEGLELDLSGSNVTYSIEGNLEVEGAVSLPSSVTPEDIAALPITGDGAVKVQTAEGEEQVYTTSGDALNAVAGLDFTNVGDEDGQTPAQGECYTWDEITKTLTLNSAYVSGVLNLPTDSTILLNGTSVVAGDVTVEGEASDAFTISGEGSMTSAGGKKFVSHAYGAPAFTWTEEADGYTAKATFTCLGGEKTQTVDAAVTVTRKDATCKEQGEITYTAKVSFAGAEYTYSKQNAVPMLMHTWDSGVVTKEATNTAKGEKTYTCTGCQEQRIETIEMTGTNEKNEGNESGGSNDPTEPDETVEKPEVGMTISDSRSKAIYVITKVDAAGGTVEYVKSMNSSAKTVTIPGTVQAYGMTYKVTGIAAKAFKGKSRLTKVTIGSNVKTIGKEAFSGCKKLKTVKLGKNVTTIGDKAFYNCGRLTSITIPSKVSKIGKQAFQKCKNLKTITIESKKLKSSKVGKNAFKGIKSTATIKVPKKKYQAYKTMLQKKGVSTKATFKKI